MPKIGLPPVFLKSQIPLSLAILDFGICSLLVHSLEVSASTQNGQKQPKLPISAVASFNYTDSTISKAEGAVEGLTLGLDLGVTLTPTSSFFFGASYQQGPLGLQDLKLGISKIFLLNVEYIEAISATLSLPTSKFSQSARLITQTTAANSLIFRRGPFGTVSTVFAGKSFYSYRPKILLSSDIYPSPVPGPVNPSTIARPVGTPSNGSDPAAERDPILEESGTSFSSSINQNLLDEFYGASFGINYSLLAKLSFDPSLSVTRLSFSKSPSTWATDVTPVQFTWTKKKLSMFASYSLFINSPVIQIPHSASYTVGAAYTI